MSKTLDSLRRIRVSRVDDSGDVQRVQTQAHGQPLDADHLLPFGLACNPPKESRGVVATIGGALDHLIAWGFSLAKHRPRDLASGDVTLYSGHDAALDLRSGGATVRGPKLSVEGYTESADGYRSGGATGASGTLTHTDTQSGGQFVMEVRGGIVVSVSTTAPTSWLPVE